METAFEVGKKKEKKQAAQLEWTWAVKEPRAVEKQCKLISQVKPGYNNKMP